MNPLSTTKQEFIAPRGALTGNQAVQQVKAVLKAIYLSGWQVAADANMAGRMDPDQKIPCELAAMDYNLLFAPLAGFHALNCGMLNLARDFNKRGMPAYAKLQEAEFAGESFGYSATRHQREVGAGYFDEVNVIISAGRVVSDRLARFYGGRTASSPGDCGDARRSGKSGFQFARN